MPTLSIPARLAATLALALALVAPALADEPKPPPVAPQPADERTADQIKPLPPFEIPDDPPPHEGAMITIPYVVEPPDIIVVEVLEALPGRPITGEHLVESDGTINLGFYGRVPVAGLTVDQVKVKTILHLRRWIGDEFLGLLKINRDFLAPDAEEMNSPPMPREGRSPFDLDDKAGPSKPTPPTDPSKPGGVDETQPPPAIDQPGSARPSTPAPGAKPTARMQSIRSTSRLTFTRAQAPKEYFSNRQDDPTALLTAPKPKQGGTNGVRASRNRRPGQGVAEDQDQSEAIAPEDSDRVFVQMTMFNTKVYYVAGDVGRPGRIPFTGRETVLDALNYAGGLLSTGDPGNIHLRRPARGSKPTRDYKIDLEAIHNGEPKANLQLFPGDRLVIGRDPIVKKAAEIDRMAAPFNSIYNQMLQYSFALRTMATARAPMNNAVQIKIGGQNYTLAAGEPGTLNVAERDAMMKDWIDLWWSAATMGMPTVDEKALRDAVIKGLNPSTQPKK